ncbi:CHMP3 [Branchiostoma lanceolatum]|uniref:CHMP3 protein n=1 Tax=Branchiostoma lanceolatum TaxID=7740 RepID=A0A8J9VXU4_BRALA|nr:CHMP3 [Branchiostoma lanceolatum]
MGSGASVKKKETSNNPRDKIRAWQRQLKQEHRILDREIGAFGRAEAETKKKIREAAKKKRGSKDACVQLARQIVQNRKAVTRLYAAKAKLNAVENSLKLQLANVRLINAFESSTEIMKDMQSLLQVSQIQKTVSDLTKEMVKAGVIEEVLEDAFDDMEDQEEVDALAEEEVEKVLFELTQGALGKAPAVVSGEPGERIKEEDGIPTQEQKEKTAAND